MGIFIFWLIFAIIVGIAASKRGRSSLGWFLIAILISPLLAILLLVCLRNIKKEEIEERRHKELLAAAAGK